MFSLLTHDVVTSGEALCTEAEHLTTCKEINTFEYLPVVDSDLFVLVNKRLKGVNK